MVNTTSNRRVVVGSTNHMDVNVCGSVVPAVIDSGSERTLVSKSTADDLGLQLEKSNRQVLGAATERLTVYGASKAVLEVGGHEVAMDVLVCSSSELIS